MRSIMDERFGEWMRDALADIDDTVLTRRWGAVERLAGELKEKEILDLLLYSADPGTATGRRPIARTSDLLPARPRSGEKAARRKLD